MKMPSGSEETEGIALHPASKIDGFKLEIESYARIDREARTLSIMECHDPNGDII
jgi:hypothetical protein